MTDNELNAAIDRVAQLWTAHEAGPELRVRVIGRLAIEPGHRAKAWSRILLPAAVAAGIVTAVVIRRPPPAENVVLTSAAIHVSNIALPATRPALTDVIEQARFELVAAQVVPMRRPAFVPITMSAIDRLAPPRLDVTSIAVGTIDTGTSIQVPQLDAITPLEIAPIADPQGDRP
ncbi:MAG TPA: hypothetical protein VH583_17345 [Vicinamibacterales bacterium]|jgi:hypothetical protein